MGKWNVQIIFDKFATRAYTLVGVWQSWRFHS